MTISGPRCARCGSAVRWEESSSASQQVCVADALWCIDNPLPGRERVTRGLIESTIDDQVDRRCRVCACTDLDCSRCIARTGEPCTWVEPDLCSACWSADRPPERPLLDRARLWLRNHRWTD